MNKNDEEVLFSINLGLYIIGSYEKESKRAVGCIADALMPVGNNPFMIALALENRIYTKECIEKTGEFSVSVLPKTTDAGLIYDFGFQSSEKVDKWNGVPIVKDGDLPLLKNAVSRISAKVVSAQQIKSDYTLFIAEVTKAEMVKSGAGAEGLTYAYYRKNMRGEIAAKIAEGNPQNKGKWVCTVCGYVYDGETPFEELPEEWVCPVCCVGKECFNKV